MPEKVRSAPTKHCGMILTRMTGVVPNLRTLSFCFCFVGRVVGLRELYFVFLSGRVRGGGFEVGVGLGLGNGKWAVVGSMECPNSR